MGMCEVAKDAQEKKEPSIISNGNTLEEIFNWMKKKLDARSLAITLKTEMDSLDCAQILTQERLSTAESDSFIDIVQK